MKISFYEARDAFYAAEEIAAKIRHDGSITVGDVMEIVYLSEQIDEASFDIDVIANFGWVSTSGMMCYPAPGDRWILELPNPDDISPVIKAGKKVDKASEPEDKNEEDEPEKSLEKRIADLEDRVLRLEYPSRWTWWDESPEDASARAAKNRAFLDRINSWIDSLTGGNS